MVKKNIGNEPEPLEPIEPTEPPEEVKELEEPQVPTAEEMASLQTQIQDLTQQVGDKDKSYKGLQQTLNKKDAELGQSRDFHSRMDGFEETQKILAGMLNEKFTSGEGLEPTEKTDYLKQFDEMTKRQKAEREQAQLRTKQEDYSRQADAVFTRAKEVFKDDDESLERVEDLLMNGRLDRAEARIAKAEGKPMGKPNEPKGSTETEDEIYERIARKRGLLKGESLTPSGKTRTPQQALQSYIDGELSEDEYSKVRDKLTFQNLEK